MKMNLLRSLSLSVLAAICLAAAIQKAIPRFRARITCFNGKLDSGSHCSANNFQTNGTTQPGGKMTCGLPGLVSEIEWTFIEPRAGKDVYRFTRRFPLDTAVVRTTSTNIVFSDARIVIFQDKSQSIIIEPARK